MNDDELRRWATAPMRIDPVRSDQLAYRVAALEKVILAGAADLQPVVALLSAGADVTPEARLLVQRAFDTLVTASADHG